MPFWFLSSWTCPELVVNPLCLISPRSARQRPHTGPAHSHGPSPGAEAASVTSSAPWPPQGDRKTGPLWSQYLRRELWHCCDAPGRNVCLQGERMRPFWATDIFWSGVSFKKLRIPKKWPESLQTRCSSRNVEQYLLAKIYLMVATRCSAAKLHLPRNWWNFKVWPF